MRSYRMQVDVSYCSQTVGWVPLVCACTCVVVVEFDPSSNGRAQTLAALYDYSFGVQCAVDRVQFDQGFLVGAPIVCTR
jgi:hypothetical protein